LPDVPFHRHCNTFHLYWRLLRRIHRMHLKNKTGGRVRRNNVASIILN
jgi:hypothetical protein